MIGDKIIIKEEYHETAKILLPFILKIKESDKNKIVVIVGGESGSGKSVTAICLKIQLGFMDINASILHQDDYFMYPPKENAIKRKQDINWVGTGEVKIDLLEEHINKFQLGEKRITKPIIDYKSDIVLSENINFESSDVLIVEGTYTMLLENADYYIFIEKNYLETLEQRKTRGRDIVDEYSSKILEIEHRIISPTIKKANAIIKKDYSVKILS
jgi:uridine kinase